MWLAVRLIPSFRFITAKTSPALMALLLISCGNDTRQVTVDSPIVSLPGQAEQRETTFGDTTRATDTTSTAVPAPTEVRVIGLRAGYVSLQWTPSSGDAIRHHPAEDSVSYYRVLRNGEPFTKSFSPFIEDTDPPEGQVVYEIQAVKYESINEFSVDHSEMIQISVVVPSSSTESKQLGGVEINASTVHDRLDSSQTCVNAFQRDDGAVLCVNQSGWVWTESSIGVAGEIQPLTSASGNGLLVTVENQKADLGPIPDTPIWSVTQLSTGRTHAGEFGLASQLQPGERHLVNGVAVSDNDEIYVSGTVYQSYLPRNLGPGPGVLPVTNAYFVLQFDAATDSVTQFQRFSIADAPGAVTSVNNGVVQLFNTGLITWLDSSTLRINAQLRVTGHPVLEQDGFVYTRSESDAARSSYYRFEL